MSFVGALSSIAAVVVLGFAPSTNFCDIFIIPLGRIYMMVSNVNEKPPAF